MTRCKLKIGHTWQVAAFSIVSLHLFNFQIGNWKSKTVNWNFTAICSFFNFENSLVQCSNLRLEIENVRNLTDTSDFNCSTFNFQINNWKYAVNCNSFELSNFVCSFFRLTISNRKLEIPDNLQFIEFTVVRKLIVRLKI